MRLPATGEQDGLGNTSIRETNENLATKMDVAMQIQSPLRGPAILSNRCARCFWRAQHLSPKMINIAKV